MKISELDITPDLAEEWLAHNTHNRATRYAVIARYAEAMRAGEWRNDISPIAFAGKLGGRGANKPVLLNGQHRLRAIIESGATVRLLVAEGLDTEDQEEIDTGTKRQLADQLRLMHISNPMELGSILRLSYCRMVHRTTNLKEVSTTRLLRYFADNPAIEDAVSPARRLYTAIGGRTSVWGTAWWELIQVQQLDGDSLRDDLEAFWEMLITGADLSVGHPALALRNLVLGLRGNQNGIRRVHIRQMDLLAVTYKAWNAWRDGVTVRDGTLKYRGGGTKPEPFPDPH
jgi:hypothetical protein